MGLHPGSHRELAGERRQLEETAAGTPESRREGAATADFRRILAFASPLPDRIQPHRKAGVLRVFQALAEPFAGLWSASRASVSSRPSTAITSNSGGEVERPVRAARNGCAAWPSLMPTSSAKART